MADSENPTISSGLQTLTKGKLDFLARLAANAVLPEFGGPSIRIETRPAKMMEIKTQVKYYVNISKYNIQLYIRHGIIMLINMTDNAKKIQNWNPN